MMVLTGQFQPPGDKSISHRIALVSLLARGTCTVTGFASGKDCSTSLAAVTQLGSRVEHSGAGIEITGADGKIVSEGNIDCGNSGTTMRLIMGILAGRTGQYRLTGDASLSRRPMARIAEPLERFGARIETHEGTPPVTVHGGSLTGISYTLPVPSAQLKSALLLAGIQADGKTQIREPIRSRDHTERLLGAMGASLYMQSGKWTISKSDLKLPESFAVPGDPSSAAFLLCGAAVLPGSDVTARNVLLNHTRTGWLDVLRRMGARIKINTGLDTLEPMGSIRIMYTGNLRACEILPEEIPGVVDEVPILALVATQCRGTTVFREAGELRVKETDRLAAIATELKKLDANVTIHGNDLHVTGPTVLKPPRETLESYHDHRIAMTLRIATLLMDNPAAVIEGESCTDISFPEFHEILQLLSVENGKNKPVGNVSVGTGLVPVLTDGNETYQNTSKKVVAACERMGTRPIPTPLPEINDTFNADFRKGK